MSYKETLFFIAKCLTISKEQKNFEIVSNMITSNQINWDNIVKVSTGHYVFPALYCNLKDKNLLTYLPNELVSFMEHISGLNRDRNIEILKQAKQVNKLLKENQITPIFLKGTAFLLQGLYDDIAERMVGDIDFIVSENEYYKTIHVLKSNGYSTIIDEKYNIHSSIHFPKMISDNSFTSVEVHKKLILKSKNFIFKYETLSINTVKVDGFLTPSFKNQIIHNCINKQISDSGIIYKNISLRNSYDLYLLGLKEETKNIFDEKNYFYNKFNAYIGISKLVFNSSYLKHNHNRKINREINFISFFTKNIFIAKVYRKICKAYLLTTKYFVFLLKSTYKKENREYLKYRFSSKS